MAQFDKNKENKEQKPAETPVKSPIALREEQILAFWREQEIFKKTLEKEAPAGEFIFYDGPPFATGEPHFGHILPGTIKDAIPRYKTMRGFRVPRRWGWDCHGLPVENLVEKELGLGTRKDIEDYGIEKFNAAARASVLRYDAVWKKIVPRTGRFVDMDNAYLTMDWRYTESIWWSFKKLTDAGLVYQGFKPMYLCPRCETTLSNFEVGLNYKELTDISVYVKFELVDAQGKETGEFLLAWTTTPWTLPGNVALAVNPKIEYVKIEDKKTYILARERYESLKDGWIKKGIFSDSKIIETFSGSELINKKYKPVFSYYQNSTDLKNKENLYVVVGADFVTTTDGTGIVHIAPAFGEDDYNLAQTARLPFIQHVGIDGRFKKEVTDFAGQLVKPKPTAEEPNAHQKADVEIIKNLALRGLLFEKEKIIHAYPHCWRCDTPLLNYATSSWFVKVTDFKEKLVAENKKVHWVPEEIGQKRFGTWLQNARDWAVSRSRFWGAPLPVWKCEHCETAEYIGSVEELAEKLKRNRYFLMRHGQAESNIADIISPFENAPDPLTTEGRKQVKEAAKKMPSKIDLIFSSPFERTRQTAELVAAEIGHKEKIIFDERLRELGAISFAGKTRQERNTAYAEHGVPAGDETVANTLTRLAEFFHEIDAKYAGKTILVISHAAPLSAALQLVEHNRRLADGGECDMSFMNNAEIRELPFAALPHGADFVLDLHRPYIDAVQFPCGRCGGTMKRVADVFDAWYESGSMPFASVHFPFEQVDNKKPQRFPANFIAEGQDQTRGWFYTLIILSTALFGQAPYENVVVNGIVLAEDGQKMAKKLKNYPDISLILDNYGADALRYYLLSSPVVEAEDLAFSEKGVDEVVKKILNRLENVYTFYALYADGSIEPSTDSPHVLDCWILARLNDLGFEVTEAMERYELDKAARPFADFIDDLSTWYLRRSRERFKNDENITDKKAALATTRFVFLALAKLLAPFMPFVAEDLYQKVKTSKNAESVHLETWPEPRGGDQQVLVKMKNTRAVVSLVLEVRATKNIKIRQPLAGLSIGRDFSMITGEFAELIKDEVNVKKISIDPSQAESVKLNTEITPALRDEGIAREFIRSVQELRKKMRLTPSQDITLTIDVSSQGQKILETYRDDIKKVVRASKLSFDKMTDVSEKISIENFEFSVILES